MKKSRRLTGIIGIGVALMFLSGSLAMGAQQTVNPSANVGSSISLTLSGAGSVAWGSVLPGDIKTGAITATVKSNKAWGLSLYKDGDLKDAATLKVIPSSQFLYGVGANPVSNEFPAVDTEVASGGKTGTGTDVIVNYKLTVTWNDEPGTYSATHYYTAVQK